MTPDIEVRIAADFAPADREEAAGLLQLLAAELGGGGVPRVLRCVVFLSGGDLSRLAHFADRAREDPRNVMYWAEYDEQDCRIRDFDGPLSVP